MPAGMSTSTAQVISRDSVALRAARSATLFSSTVGRKAVMAASGIVLFGFVFVHMVGNLQIFLGPAALNGYGALLRHAFHGAGLWIARLTLLGAAAAHTWAAASLTIENRAARPVRYRVTAHAASTYASRTMVWSGPILLLFVVYHLLHFTIGSVHPSFAEGDVYHNVVAGFQVAPVSLFYILSMLALGLHMQHGIWSMLQTLGLSHPRWNRLRLAFSTAATAVVVLGNCSIPIAVMTGLIR